MPTISPDSVLHSNGAFQFNTRIGSVDRKLPKPFCFHSLFVLWKAFPFRLRSMVSFSFRRPAFRSFSCGSLIPSGFAAHAAWLEAMAPIARGKG